MTLLWFLTILTLLALYAQTEAQINSASPCPGLFVYEGGTPEPDRWYGVVILLSDVDVSGVWLSFTFDRPSVQLGNWFGQVETTNHKEYQIKNSQAALKANIPQTVRFFIKYDTSKPPPRLISFRLNGRTVCTADSSTDVPPVEPYTNPSEGGGGGGRGEVARPLGSFNVDGTSLSTGEEDYFPGDFSHRVNRTQLDNENLNEICGTVAALPRPLIADGQELQEGQYPWHATLYQRKGSKPVYTCGASLISKYHVLTTAHCVTIITSRTSRPLHPEDLIVYLGKFYLNRFSSTGIQDRQASDIFSHPQFDPQTYINNIALVKLTAPADFTDYVRPICLWQGSTDLSAVVNKLGSIVGWAYDETGKGREELNEARMPILSKENCLFSDPKFYSRFTTSNTYYAGFTNGSSVCNGDAGGGMVFPKPNFNPKNPRWQIRGIMSVIVVLHNQKCDTSRYVVFTDCAKYLDWIRETMQK